MARSRRACPERSRRNPGDACWQMLFGAFRPQTIRKIKKVTSSERTRISYSLLSPATTHVVLPKENHMQLTEAATLDRKIRGSRPVPPCPGSPWTDLQFRGPFLEMFSTERGGQRKTYAQIRFFQVAALLHGVAQE